MQREMRYTSLKAVNNDKVKLKGSAILNLLFNLVDSWESREPPSFSCSLVSTSTKGDSILKPQ